MSVSPDPVLAPERTWFRSLVGEWVAAPPQSEWSRRVNDDRIVNQDRIRPYTSRLALLVVMTGCLLLCSEPRWAWLLLLLGVLQATIELLYEPATRARHEVVARRTRPGRWIIRVFYWNYQHGITNVPGVVGLAASIANIWVVTFASGPVDDRAWLKVSALACAVMYAVSGALGPLIDTATYDPASRISVGTWRVLRALWVPVGGVIVVAVVWSDQTRDAWRDALPYALLTVALAYYPMLRVREFERAMNAGRAVAQQLQDEQNLALALDLHHLLQPVKASLKTARDVLPDPSDRAELDQYIRNMAYIYEGARERRLDARDGLIQPLEPELRQIAEAGMVRLTYEVDLGDHHGDDDHRLAKQCLITFLENSVQAYAMWTGAERPSVTVSARPVGPRLVVEVTDLLGLVPDDVWSGSPTLGAIRSDVVRRGGELVQLAATNGKTVRASWPVSTQLRIAITDETTP